MLRLGALALLIGAGLAAFAAFALALGVTDWRELRAQLVRYRESRGQPLDRSAARAITTANRSCEAP